MASMASVADDLTYRLQSLEEQVYGGGGPTPEQPLRQVVEQLREKLRELEGEDFRPFQKKHEDVMALLGLRSAEEFLLTSDAKAEVVLASEDVVRETAKRLETLTHAQESVEKTGVTRVSGMTQHVRDVQGRHLHQLEALACLSHQLEELLHTYDSTASLLSMKFVQMDALLRQWEAKVDNLLRRKTS